MKIEQSRIAAFVQTPIAVTLRYPYALTSRGIFRRNVGRIYNIQRLIGTYNIVRIRRANLSDAARCRPRRRPRRGPRPATNNNKRRREQSPVSSRVRCGGVCACGAGLSAVRGRCAVCRLEAAADLRLGDLGPCFGLEARVVGAICNLLHECLTGECLSRARPGCHRAPQADLLSLRARPR